MPDQDNSMIRTGISATRGAIVGVFALLALAVAAPVAADASIGTFETAGTVTESGSLDTGGGEPLRYFVVDGGPELFCPVCDFCDLVCYEVRAGDRVTAFGTLRRKDGVTTRRADHVVIEATEVVIKTLEISCE